MQPNDNGKELRTLLLGITITLLAFHFYYFCYGALREVQLTHPIIDRFVKNMGSSGIWKNTVISKLLALLFLVASRIGDGSSTASIQKKKTHLYYIVAGALLYLGSFWLFRIPGSLPMIAGLYAASTILGMLLLLPPINHFIGLIHWPQDDPFNTVNQTFPQQEAQINDPKSLSFPARYRLKNSYRRSHINLVNPSRGTIILGNPGSGKTLYFFRPIIDQCLAKGYTAFIYDFKYDTLSRHTYNKLQEYRSRYPIPPAFFVINFDDPEYSHRCNVLSPDDLEDLADASESAKVLLTALNKTWAHKEGDFFVDSAITFTAACIWFLKKFEQGRYCTLPHLIELLKADYDPLFSVLRSVAQIDVSAFISAYLSNTMEQLEGQIASARIALSSLSDPNIYYVLSGNEFSLDINNPNDPKIVCMGSNPKKQHTYGAVISLYTTRLSRLINKPGQIPCLLAFDEFATIRFPGIETLLATGRSNQIALVMGVQDLSQLRQVYGRDQADILFNLPGNMIAGMANGETARLISERIGKINQQKQSTTSNSRDTATSQSTHLDPAVPPSTISSLSAGEFVGIVADEPGNKIRHKAFHAERILDIAAQQKAESAYQPLPRIRTLTTHEVQDNFNQIKSDIQKILTTQLAKMSKSPALSKLIIKK